MVFLPKYQKPIDNRSCKAVVSDGNRQFSNGDTSTIHYNDIHADSNKNNRQLELGDIIAVTYSGYEYTNGTYSISVEYVDLVAPTE